MSVKSVVQKGLGINCVDQMPEQQVFLKMCRHQQKGLGINCVGQISCVKEVLCVIKKVKIVLDALSRWIVFNISLF